MLLYHFNWHQLSAMAGITWRRWYFRLFPGSVKGPQINEFLQVLQRQLRRPLLIIWDGLPALRSRLARDYVETKDGAIQLERLPAYAPDLNPVEYIWSYRMRREVVHFCPQDFAVLTTSAPLFRRPPIGAPGRLNWRIDRPSDCNDCS